MHRLRQVRHRVPARGDSDEGVRARAQLAGCGRRRLEDEVVPQPRGARHVVDHPGRARRLHRLRSVRHRLPGARQERGQAQEHQPAPDRRAPRRRACRMGRLPARSRDRPGAVGSGVGQDQPAPPTAVRVQRRVRGLWRDAVPQAAHAAVRRSPADRQRNRLQQHLRRQPADHSVLHQRRRSRSGVEQQPLRGQRRVRSRHPAGHRRPAERRTWIARQARHITPRRCIDPVLASCDRRRSRRSRRAADSGPASAGRAAAAGVARPIDHDRSQSSCCS